MSRPAARLRAAQSRMGARNPLMMSVLSIRRALATIVVFAVVSLAASLGMGATTQVVVVELDGAITPAAADYTVRAIRKAAESDAALVVLKLDTPGGLDTSMRSIIKAILASRVPVATFVAPDGARAASAGTYILYASHIAAMAPATNLGAATPVSIGGEDSGPAAGDKAARSKDKAQPTSRESLRSKQINDAAAYIRSLAQMRGRNGDWGEKAVREAVSLSAAEAHKLKVIDFVAIDVPDLLKQLDGRKVRLAGGERLLKTADATIVEVEPDWRTRLLMVVTNPSVAVILMMIGVYGLIFEFMNPGFVLPGVLGGICLLIALYAFQLLPINYAGIALMLLGIVFIVGEAFMPSFGALGIGGIAALAIGMFVLIDPETAPGYNIPLSFIAGFVTLMGITIFATAWIALKARRRPVVTGREDLQGAEVIVLGDFEREGWARVHGETWRVVSPVPMKEGERARVVGINGLTLTIQKA
jgi:membrane-bound serine protease (ClpP class)